MSTSDYQFHSSRNDAYMIRSRAHSASSAISTSSSIGSPLANSSPRIRAAQMSLRPLRTQELPHEDGYTPATPKFMRYKEMHVAVKDSHNYAALFGNRLHAKFHGFVVGWLCGV